VKTKFNFSVATKITILSVPVPRSGPYPDLGFFPRPARYVAWLDSQDFKKKLDLENTKQKIMAKKKAKVPIFTGKRNSRMLKVKLTASADSEIPDPALVVSKAAISWSERFGVKTARGLPRDKPEIDPEDAEQYEIAREQLEDRIAATLRPPEDLALLAAALAGSSL